MKETRISAAAYVRTADRESASSQRAAIDAWLNGHPDHELSMVYEDEATLGLMPIAMRPGGDALLDDAEERKFRVLLVPAFHRLSRIERNLEAYKQFFDALSITVVEVEAPEADDD